MLQSLQSPSVPIEEFLRLTLENGSALGFLGIAQGAAKAQTEGTNAFARALLNWYIHGKRFFHAIGFCFRFILFFGFRLSLISFFIAGSPMKKHLTPIVFSF